MAIAVCLNTNIYDEDGNKHLRGDSFEASQEWISGIISGDDLAERPHRITTVAPIKRQKKGASNENT